MALTTSPTDDRFVDILILESGLGNVAVADLAGKPASIYSVDINNPSGGLAHVKFYDSTSGSASDIPIIILMVVAGDRRVFTMPDGIAFANAITMRCVVEAGTAGTTSPSGGSGTVAVSLVMS